MKLSYFVIACLVLPNLSLLGDELESIQLDGLATEVVYSESQACDELGPQGCDCAASPNCDDCCSSDSCCPYTRWFSGDRLKGKPLGECGWYDIGGSYRARYHLETNMRPGTTGGLSGVDDSFWLHQTRLWLDGQFNSRVGFRFGFIDAASAGEDFPSRSREVNRHDLYQAYLNISVRDDVIARVGRQEMRYGSARLIMAPNWANRRRSHDGVRFIWDADEWEVNPFWVRPVERDREHFRQFDGPNPDQQLYGIFSTRTKSEHEKADLYWLAFDVEDARYDTFGTRLYGDCADWLYEFEGGIQLGENPDDTDHVAGFCTLGLGKKFSSVKWKPELWVYFDWASGDDTVGNGFHSYVQRAHYYLGFMDLFGRRNIEDINIRLTTKPCDKWTLVAWCHFFSLANGNDVPYNVNMSPYAGLPAGSSGSQTLGTELDLLATYDVNDQLQLRFGYSHFWSGSYYDTTPGVPTNIDANFFYSHVQYRF